MIEMIKVIPSIETVILQEYLYNHYLYQSNTNLQNRGCPLPTVQLYSFFFDGSLSCLTLYWRVDGTTNFVHSNPNICTILAFMVEKVRLFSSNCCC